MYLVSIRVILALIMTILTLSLSPSRYNYTMTPLRPINRKDQKKVDKLTAQIPYHEGRSEKDEVAKIKERIDTIWAKAKETQGF